MTVKEMKIESTINYIKAFLSGLDTSAKVVVYFKSVKLFEYVVSCEDEGYLDKIYYLMDLTKIDVFHIRNVDLSEDEDRLKLTVTITFEGNYNEEEFGMDDVEVTNLWEE